MQMKVIYIHTVVTGSGPTLITESLGALVRPCVRVTRSGRTGRWSVAQRERPWHASGRTGRSGRPRCPPGLRSVSESTSATLSITTLRRRRRAAIVPQSIPRAWSWADLCGAGHWPLSAESGFDVISESPGTAWDAAVATAPPMVAPVPSSRPRRWCEGLARSDGVETRRDDESESRRGEGRRLTTHRWPAGRSKSCRPHPPDRGPAHRGLSSPVEDDHQRPTQVERSAGGRARAHNPVEQGSSGSFGGYRRVTKMLRHADAPGQTQACRHGRPANVDSKPPVGSGHMGVALASPRREFERRRCA
jgi:hypothetical protein